MKVIGSTIGGTLFAVLSVAFIFWPWILAAITAVQWFFASAPLYAWWTDVDRIGFVVAYPFVAVLVWVFLMWLFSGVLELF